jgi:hypothetical protein
LSPFYLLLVSFASWRALWEWTRQPFVWTKTDHAPRRAAADKADRACATAPDAPALAGE